MVITTLKLVGGISLTGCVDTVYHLFHPVSLNELLFGFPKALKDSRIKPKRCIIVSRPETDELMLQLRKFPGTMEEWKVFKQEMLHIIDMLKRDDICRSGLISQHCQSRKLPFDFCNRQYKCQYCEKVFIFAIFFKFLFCGKKKLYILIKFTNHFTGRRGKEKLGRITRRMGKIKYSEIRL